MLLLFLYFIYANKIDLRVSNEGNHILLNWTGFSTNQSLTYTSYSQRKGSGWKPLSSFDLNTTKNINVLNVYPLRDAVYVTYNYTDQSTLNMSRSASLKVWMEGGYYINNETNFSFDALGANPFTGEQIMHVTPVSSSEFEEMSLEDMTN